MSRKFKTYYVSGINGDDCNNGEAPETAFGSLDRINNLELNPGDRVLLERGSVFENQYLHIKGRGTRSDKIEIGAYGEGTCRAFIQTAPEYGIRIMEHRWTRRLMYIKERYPLPYFFMMWNIFWFMI